mmetsp:Transcript_64438/g.104252  ORF Transcript_64438/g.104252 Transcript_64438/m.104252 type:complete len:149 (+) Transcript_64438:3-449(+)
MMMARVAAFCAIAVSGTSAFMGGSLAPACLNRLPLATSSRRPTLEGPKMVDITVRVNDGEPIEAALRRFKISCARSGHLMELKRRRQFETNNEKMIRKNKESMRNRSMAKKKSQSQQFGGFFGGNDKGGGGQRPPVSDNASKPLGTNL